jgi:hypothetical protein
MLTSCSPKERVAEGKDRLFREIEGDAHRGRPRLLFRSEMHRALTRQRQRLRFGCLRRHAYNSQQRRCRCFHGEAPAHRKPLNAQINADPRANTKVGGTSARGMADAKNLH